MDDHSRLPQRTDTEVPATSMADFDETQYRPYLEEFDLTEEQASEYLRIVWDIMRTFVMLKVPSETWGQIVGPVINPAPDDSDEG